MPDVSRKRLSAAGRIRSSPQFKSISRRGRRIHTRHFLIIASTGETDQSRLGVSVSKRVGNAVYRNYVKRRIREFFRLNRDRLKSPLDLVVIAKPGAAALDFSQMTEQLEEIFKCFESSCSS